MTRELTKRSDQWDIRLNIEGQDHLDQIVAIAKEIFEKERIRYIHVTNVEVGTVPGRSSYGVEHVHIALCLVNPTSKGSIIKKWVQGRSIGWYIEPRDKTKPIEGEYTVEDAMLFNANFKDMTTRDYLLWNYELPKVPMMAWLRRWIESDKRYTYTYKYTNI